MNDQRAEDLDQIPFRFTAKEWDEETKLYYMSARYQNPMTSRWISADPAGVELFNPMEKDENGKLTEKTNFSFVESQNWYSYVGNNPISFVDPTGKEIEKAEQVGRCFVIGSSTLETLIGIGLILIPDPATTTAGIIMLAHGGLNTAAASSSMHEYNSSDGNNELPTSALGMLSYAAYSDDKTKATAISTMADLTDGIAAAVLSPQNIPKLLSTVSSTGFLIGASGYILLSGTTMEDLGWAFNMPDE